MCAFYVQGQEEDELVANSLSDSGGVLSLESNSNVSEGRRLFRSWGV